MTEDDKLKKAKELMAEFKEFNLSEEDIMEESGWVRLSKSEYTDWLLGRRESMLGRKF